MKSKSHSENILNGNYVYGAVGYYQKEDRVICCSSLLYTPKAS